MARPRRTMLRTTKNRPICEQIGAVNKLATERQKGREDSPVALLALRGGGHTRHACGTENTESMQVPTSKPTDWRTRFRAVHSPSYGTRCIRRTSKVICEERKRRTRECLCKISTSKLYVERLVQCANLPGPTRRRCPRCDGTGGRSAQARRNAVSTVCKEVDGRRSQKGHAAAVPTVVCHVSGDFSTRLLIVSRRVLRTRGEGRQRPSTTRAFFCARAFEGRQAHVFWPAKASGKWYVAAMCSL
jgi:hypothetical protein